MTPTEFVTARLDEDQAHAEKDIWAANRASGDWRALYGVNLPSSYLDVDGGRVAEFIGAGHEQDVLLAARFKSSTVRARAERVLAQVAAMRAIVGDYERLDRESDQSDGLADLAARVAAAAASRDAVRHLAAIWRDHPDYDPAWAPEGE